MENTKAKRQEDKREKKQGARYERQLKEQRQQRGM